MKEIKIKLDEGAKAPIRAYPSDAGLDLFSRESVVINAKERYSFDIGVHVDLPEGYTAFVKSRSGLFKKHGIITTGVVDAGYTGSIGVTLYNSSGFDYRVHAGDKIAQLVILPIETPEVVVVDEISEAERGSNGFGSSGR